MPTPLIIDNELSPNKEYTFRVNLTLGGESVFSRNITFRTPNAAKLLSRTGQDFTYKILRDIGEKVPSTKTWDADRYQKIKVSGSECIQLRLVNTSSGYEELSVGTKIKFQTLNSSFLSILNNTEAPIVKREKNNDGRTLVTLKISKARWDAISTAINVGQNLSPTSNNRISLTTTRVVRKSQVSVSVDKSIIDGLVKMDNVEDILVFAFRQYDGTLNSTAKRYYLKEIPEKTNQYIVGNNPLSYSNAKSLFQKNNKQIYNFSNVRFDPKEGKKFIIYATIVRYIKSSTEWKLLERNEEGVPDGWLQINTDNEPIWARAVVAST